MQIRLWQLMQYFDMEDDPVDKIQIVATNQEWAYADELYGNSELLQPFWNWVITDIRCEESYENKRPILRIIIQPN